MTSTVLLTATVRPNTQLFLTQSDPAERLAQYRRAIARWAEDLEPIDAELVVVETSGAGRDELLTEIPKARRSAVAVLSYNAGEVLGAVGKGTLEAEAIRRGLEMVLRESGADRTVYKATGRLVLANARLLVQDLGPQAVRVRMTADRTFADTRFIGGSLAAWSRVLLADADRIDEPRGVFLEHVVAGSVGRAAALKDVALDRFPVRPLFDGQSGSTGQVYGRGLRSVESLRRLAESALAAAAARKQV